MSQLDFDNTEIAFEQKSNSELRKMSLLFNAMNKPFLVNTGSELGLTALKWKVPLVKSLIKHTIFEQFVGGTNFEETQATVDKLYEYGTLSILDYGAEGTSDEAALDQTMKENLKAIEFAAENASVPVISTKISGLSRNDLLEKKQAGESFTTQEAKDFERVKERIDTICQLAHEKKVGIFFDAEESWMQDTIDDLVDEMMAKYNKERVIAFNTFQMYRHDRLQFLYDSFEKAQKEGYLLGAKLVRGAYMDKERQRAEEMGYPSPIQPNKAATDKDYNEALVFCVEHYEQISSCNATHNRESSQLLADLIAEKGIQKDHPHLNFCQLYGMSDHLTFNLAKAGYNVAKYLPYGSIMEVVPYLIRRAKENTSVTGDMSREYSLIMTEMKRRGLD